MKVDRVKDILSRIRKVKVAVVGDFCLDAYWMLDARGSEVSVETGQMGQAVARHYYSLGAASNIAANMAALEPAGIRAIGARGDDIFGREMVRQLDHLGVDTGGLIVQAEDFSTVVFGKRCLEGQELPRIDFGFFNRKSEETEQSIIAALRESLHTADAVIINQQVPGSMGGDSFIENLNALLEEFTEKIVLLDTRHYGQRFNNIYRKANVVEAAALNGVEVELDAVLPAEDVKGYAQNLFGQSGKPIFVTRGARGLVVADVNGMHEIPGIQLLKKLDTVGAGDTICSVLALCLGAGISPAESAQFANIAAAVTVQKLFRTGKASGPEILALAEDVDYVYQPELAEDIDRAAYLAGSQIELCYKRDSIPLGRVKHAVFDNDGTISTHRQGWEKVMETVMVRAILGDGYDTCDRNLYQKVLDRVRDYIDKSTGVQTIVQTEALVEMVREFRLVPEEEILDKLAYKDIYNRQLMKMVSERLEKLRRGQAKADHYLLEGALAMLRALREKGVRLYLTSGTDREDVLAEVAALGYADLFDGGIYGSVGDVQKYSKKLIIRRIIGENSLAGPELAVFGDGPVEIRQGRKNGGIAVGLATDEIKRKGLNVEKRARLVKAGVHIIVPDFAEWQKLLRLLLDGN